MKPKPIRIAHILGTLLMISYLFHFYFSDIIVVCKVAQCDRKLELPVLHVNFAHSSPKLIKMT